MDHIRNKARQLFQSGTGWVLLVAVLCMAVAVPVYATTMASIQHTYGSLYSQNKTPADQRVLVAFAGDTEDLGGKLGEIPVTVKADGNSSLHMVRGGTVKDVLKTAGISLGVYDLVKPALEHELEEFDEVVITRREYQTYTKEEEIPYETHYVYSPAVKAGEEVVEVRGEPGQIVEIYEQYLVSGEVDEESLASRDIVKHPVHEKVLMGFRSKPVSPLDFEASFDDSGEPLHYTQVLRGQRAAGYSARAGAGTASGLPAKVGHVAVNPNVIPYGSKLFIQSTDGNFVYGYAIAADTGTALMQGTIAVDLFYASYQESANNGIRQVDIFILD